MNDIIYYEQPINERMRNLLRLEHLFNHAAYTLRGYSVWDSRSTLTSITAILDILSRNDIKTELLKELERLEKTLSALFDVTGVDTEQLNGVVNQLKTSQQHLLDYPGQLGQELREHELLSSLRQRSSIVGGSCNFDIPLLHFWSQQIPEIRIKQLEDWLEILEIISHPARLILNIIRESSVAETQNAEAGFYQKNIETSTPVQLIRVGLSNDVAYFPEISAGKHRFSIRFMIPQNEQRPIQSNDNLEFKLCCCAL